MEDFECVLLKEETPYHPAQLPNEILEAGLEFLTAAQLLREVELQKGTGWEAELLQTWHVVHHLSVIAVELLMKSLVGSQIFEMIYSNALPMSEPTFVSYGKSKLGHGSFVGDLPDEVLGELQTHLSTAQMHLLKTLSVKTLAYGRYPYEVGTPHIGYAMADAWFQLAAQLRVLRLRQVGREDGNLDNDLDGDEERSPFFG